MAIDDLTYEQKLWEDGEVLHMLSRSARRRLRRKGHQSARYQRKAMKTYRHVLNPYPRKEVE